jgi:hypothetical protein
MTFTAQRNQKRADAAEQFADAADLANKNGFHLIAHSNSGYELRVGEKSVAWFFPDHSDGSLLTFVKARIVLQWEGRKC